MRTSEVLYYGWRIVKWKLGVKSPILAAVKLTYKCNLNCLHCPWVKMKSSEISVSEWINIIQAMYDEGVRVIVFEGGEPTLFDGLKELVDFSNSLRMRTVVVTNGTVDLKGLNPDLLIASIDGPKEIHDTIRGDGVYEQVLETLSSQS